MELKDYLRKMRKKAGLTQAEAAEQIDVSIDTIRNWEARGSKPRDEEVIEKIVEVYKLNRSDLRKFISESIVPLTEEDFTCPWDTNGILKERICLDDLKEYIEHKHFYKMKPVEEQTLFYALFVARECEKHPTLDSINSIINNATDRGKELLQRFCKNFEKEHDDNFYNNIIHWFIFRYYDSKSPLSIFNDCLNLQSVISLEVAKNKEEQMYQTIDEMVANDNL